MRFFAQNSANNPKWHSVSESPIPANVPKVKDGNEARLMRDITPLIIPSAESLHIRGAKHLAILIESLNETWDNSMPLTGTRPQPDNSLGFRREAFTQSQLAKMSPSIGDFLNGDQSYFMATYNMYFPFFICEVKCAAAALDVADRQNAHSMTLAVRAVTEVSRTVKREDEFSRQILAFSTSHDHRSVRLYGHYAVFNSGDTTFHRYTIHTFDFTSLKGKDRWTAYRYTKNIYDSWMPTHFAKICSAINQLPSDLDFSHWAVPRPARTPSKSLRFGCYFTHILQTVKAYPNHGKSEIATQTTL
ncbi:hypothetical protein E4U55_003476 [Claviceps digitariae]|nr:hypothetical protein E4U55_003476 [Claviceps digitariae]